LPFLPDVDIEDIEEVEFNKDADELVRPFDNIRSNSVTDIALGKFSRRGPPVGEEERDGEDIELLLGLGLIFDLKLL